MNLTEEITWIPVSERLPEKGKDILFFANHYSVMFGWLSNRFNKFTTMEGSVEETYEVREVQYWAELPRGPQP